MRTSVLALALGLLGCKDKAPDDSGDIGPTDSAPPVDSDLLAKLPVVEAVDPERNPLAFRLHVVTLEPTTLELAWGDRVLSWPADGTPATNHTVPLIGFHADATTPVDLRVLGDDAEEQHSVDVVTPPLPTVFPRIELLVRDKERMLPGYTLFTVRPGELTGPLANFEYAIVVDDDGEVVWFNRPTEKIFDASIIGDGVLMSLGRPFSGELGGPVVDSTLLGEELARYQGADSAGAGIPVFHIGFHHEAQRLHDGRTLALSKERLSGVPYPTSYEDPSNNTTFADLSADVLVEWDASGAPTGEWHFDWLPTTRIGYTGLEASNFDGLADWTHGNGADLDERDDSVIVSLRNQNAVVKMNRAGDPVWILGDPFGYPAELQHLLLQPDDTVEWFYSQHAPTLSDDGKRVLLFDNGETRGVPGDGVAIPPEEQRWSRLVEYEVDEAAGTVTQTWEYARATDGVLYSGVIGDADYLPNGNVFGTFGHVTYIDGVPSTAHGNGKRVARLIEVSRDEPEATVLDLEISSDPKNLPGGWMVYRADRVEDLY